MTTEAEALEIAKEQITELKNNCFDSLRMLERDVDMMRNSGFKSFDACAHFYIKDTAKKIEKIMRDFENEYCEW